MQILNKSETPPSLSAKRKIAICICLAAAAFGVRVLVWQNNKVAMDGVQYALTDTYKADARALLSGDIRTFVAGPNPPSDATILLHPPGYPFFIAAVYAVFGENEVFRIIQILLNSLAPALIFLITLQLFGVREAVVAGVLTAFSPQFAYHSGIVLPDELSVLPILLAVYFFVRSMTEKRLSAAVLAGISLGISCWLRSNALLLPLLFAAAALFVLPKHFRGRFALILLAAFILTIAPITVRNYIVFRSIIPLSLGMGTTFVEGLGEFDAEGRLGLPATDEGVMEMDVLKAGRPDYYGSLYNPDGVERERQRMKIGIEAVEANPLWYAKSVLLRGSMVFRMERVPVIAPERDEKNTTPPGFYYANVPLKYLQKVFITAVFLPLLIMGAILLLRTRDGRTKLIIMAVVPIYYMTVQSLIHTEYRYLLPATHVLVIIGSLPVGALTGWIANRKISKSTA